MKFRFKFLKHEVWKFENYVNSVCWIYVYSVSTGHDMLKFVQLLNKCLQYVRHCLVFFKILFIVSVNLVSCTVCCCSSTDLMICNDTLRGVPLLLLANKQDLEVCCFVLSLLFPRRRLCFHFLFVCLFVSMIMQKLLSQFTPNLWKCGTWAMEKSH